MVDANFDPYAVVTVFVEVQPDALAAPPRSTEAVNSGVGWSTPLGMAAMPKAWTTVSMQCRLSLTRAI